MIKMVKFPYNNRAIARLDSDNVVHNHLYHHCPIGKVDENNIVYNLYNAPVGRVDENGVIHSHHLHNSPVGKVDENGFIQENSCLIARVEGDRALLGGSAYLLLIHGNR